MALANDKVLILITKSFPALQCHHRHARFPKTLGLFGPRHHLIVLPREECEPPEQKRRRPRPSAWELRRPVFSRTAAGANSIALEGRCRNWSPTPPPYCALEAVHEVLE